MKRLFVVLLCVLFLTGCMPANLNPKETEGDSVGVSSATEGMTQQVTEPATDPAPTEDPHLLAEQYSLPNMDYLAFVHKKDQLPYFGFESKCDLSDLINDCLYVHHKNEDKIYQITEKPIAEFMRTPLIHSTKEHVYYVLADDLKTVYRSDFYGNDQVVVYKSESGEITRFKYYGLDVDGKLVLLIDTKRVVMYDIQSDVAETLLECHYIESAHYSVYPEGVPKVFWSGKIKKEDEFGFHYYYPDSQQHVEASS